MTARLEAPPAWPADAACDPLVERRVLATLATYPDAGYTVAADLGRVWDSCFTQPDTQAIAHAVRQLLTEQRPPDWSNLHTQMLANGDDPSLLDDLRQYAEATALLPDRCAILRDTLALRRLCTFAALVQSPGHLTLKDIAAQAHHILADAEASSVRATTAADSTQRNWALWLRRRETGSAITGIPYPWDAISTATMGMQPGKITIIGARPSHGKTACACNIAEHAASQGYPVLIFSHEMEADDLMLRIVAARAGVDYTGILSGGIQHLAVIERFRAATVEVGRLPILVCDDVGLAPSQYQALATAYAHRHATPDRPLLVIIDYIQLERIPGWRDGTRTDELAHISASWLATCRRAPISLLALAQLNRSADGSEPRVASLRDSGAIEQDAHAVLLLWREGHDNPGKPANKALLNLAKNRNGSLRRTILHFHGPSMRFRPWQPGDVERTAADESKAPTQEEF
jgi:replicative DNA helicase